MKRILILVSLVSALFAADMKSLVKFGLLDVSFGPTSWVMGGPEVLPVALPFSCLELALGVRAGDRFGAAVGTAVIQGNLFADLSYFPVRGYLFYDFSPRQPWRKGMGFLSLTYVHNGEASWHGPLEPYLKLACGASYTFYAVTPHAEVGYDFHWRFATLTAGVALGGTYVFR